MRGKYKKVTDLRKAAVKNQKKNPKELTHLIAIRIVQISKVYSFCYGCHAEINAVCDFK